MLVLLSCLSGKNDSGLNEAPPPELVDLNAWRIGNPQSDPFPEHIPEEVICPLTAFRMELEQLEVQMGLCNYAHLVFELNQDLPKNTNTELLILHTGLWAEEAALAHISWGFESDILWEANPPVPSQAEFFFIEHKTTKAYSKGELIHLHLHNHGANDWKVGYFKRSEK
ncbi:MAG: hypothetical protein CMK59_12540 [Proteobacteria bacterium]|nr:hypothetical protein [Pseudomonadota bacterium]